MDGKPRKVCARVSQETFDKFRTSFPYYGETQAFVELCVVAALDPKQYEKTIAELKAEAKKKVQEG